MHSLSCLPYKVKRCVRRQEIAQKFLEACSEIAGASLEVTTWLSRNLAVKPGPQIEVSAEVDETTGDQGRTCEYMCA